MAKPTIDDSRWGETGGGTPSPDLVDPTSGKKDAGWGDDEEPDADQQNWWQWAVFQWLKMLDVLWTSALSLVLPANQSVTVSGTGQYKHGLRELQVDPSSFVIQADATGGTPVFHGDHWTVAGGTCEIMAPIPLPVGKRIVSLSYDYNWESGSGLADFVLGKLILGTSSVIDDKQISGSGSSWATVASNSGAINHTIVTGETIRVYVLSANTSLRIGGFRVFYDEV